MLIDESPAWGIPRSAASRQIAQEVHGLAGWDFKPGPENCPAAHRLGIGELRCGSFLLGAEWLKRQKGAFYFLSWITQQDKKMMCDSIAILRCEACGGEGKMTCGACRLVSYCGQKCQTEHWPRHKKMCQICRPRKPREYALGDVNARIEKAHAQIYGNLLAVASSPCLLVDLSEPVESFMENNDVHVAHVTKAPLATEPRTQEVNVKYTLGPYVHCCKLDISLRPALSGALVDLPRSIVFNF